MGLKKVMLPTSYLYPPLPSSHMGSLGKPYLNVSLPKADRMAELDVGYIVFVGEFVDGALGEVEHLGEFFDGEEGIHGVLLSMI